MNRVGAIVLAMSLVSAVGIPACSQVATPPHSLLATRDHEALARWYEHEAANLRQRSRDMEAMIEEYDKDPERGSKQMVHPPKTDFVQECRTLARLYADAA